MHFWCPTHLVVLQFKRSVSSPAKPVAILVKLERWIRPHVTAEGPHAPVAPGEHIMRTYTAISGYDACQRGEYDVAHSSPTILGKASQSSVRRHGPNAKSSMAPRQLAYRSRPEATGRLSNRCFLTLSRLFVVERVLFARLARLRLVFTSRSFGAVSVSIFAND
jgi:hypothetical protein